MIHLSWPILYITTLLKSSFQIYKVVFLTLFSITLVNILQKLKNYHICKSLLMEANMQCFFFFYGTRLKLLLKRWSAFVQFLSPLSLSSRFRINFKDSPSQQLLLIPVCVTSEYQAAEFTQRALQATTGNSEVFNTSMACFTTSPESLAVSSFVPHTQML